MFFPASGIRFINSGDLYYVGTVGYYWSATPRDGTHGRSFGFNNGSCGLYYGNRAVGCPVRAVAE